MDIKKELAKYHLTEDWYEKLLKDCSDKLERVSDMDWGEINDKYNLGWNPDTLRKSFNTTLLGGGFVKQYMEEKYAANQSVISEDEYLEKLRIEKEELRQERIKLQTANIERNRFDRADARHKMYYEQVGQVCTTLPLPEFNPLLEYVPDILQTEYLLTLADIHYGAKFKSHNNEYSPEIFQERLELLTNELITFIYDNKLTKLHIVSLGDLLQGILRINDLRINDSSVVKATVEISRYIAMFLNTLSKYVMIEYYHVPSANHTQIRPLGSKASELMDEDLEYVVGNYIKDLCSANERINVHLAEEGKQYVEIPILGLEIIAMHGHQIKNMENALKDLSIMRQSFVEYLILGHYHAGKEFTGYESVCSDAEVLVAPSFVGSDPYSDSLMKGSKSSVKIFGFSEVYGHISTRKIVLN
jgi:hypothetical protein